MRRYQAACLCVIVAASGCAQDEQVEDAAVSVIEDGPAPCVARPSPDHLAAANGADCSYLLWFQQENGDQPVGIVVDFTSGWHGDIEDIRAVRDIDLLIGYVLPPGMPDEQLQRLGETPIMLGVDVRELGNDADERQRVDDYFPEGRTHGWEGIDSRTQPLIFLD